MTKPDQSTININVKIPNNKNELSDILEEVKQQLEKQMQMDRFDLSKIKSASHIGILGPRYRGKTTLIHTLLQELIKYEKIYGIYFTPKSDNEISERIEGYLDIVATDGIHMTDSYHASLLNWLQNWRHVLNKANQPTVVCDDIGAIDKNAYRKFKQTCELGSMVFPRRFIWSGQMNVFSDCQFLFVSPYHQDIGQYVSSGQLISQMISEKGYFVIEFNKKNQVEKISTFVPFH